MTAIKDFGTPRPAIFCFAASYLPFVGGAEIAIQKTAERLSSQFDFFIVTSRQDRRLPARERRPEGMVIRLGWGTRFDKWLLPFAAQYFFASNFQLLTSNFAKPRGLVLWGMDISQGALAAGLIKFFRPRIPFVFTIQYGESEERLRRGRLGLIRRAFRFLLGQADAVTAISTYLIRLAREYGYRGNAALVPNGTEIIKNKKSKIKNQRGGEEPRIITVSRLVHKNGVDTLIRAFAEARKTALDARLHIVGDGPERKYLEALAQELGVSEEVTFVGKVEPEQVADYLGRADVFVRMSRSEGMGNAFVEAMAIGLPVIGTPVGGITDIIEDGKTGLFARVDDPADCGRKIIRLLDNPAEAAALGEQGRRLVGERFSWNAITASYGRIFRERLEQRNRVLVATGLFPPAIGGPATYSKILLDEMPSQGWDVKVADFGSVLCLPKIIRHLGYFFHILARGRTTDVIFAQDPASVGLPALAASRLLRKPFALKVAGDYAWEQAVQRFGVSDLLDQFLEKRYGFRIEFLKWIERRVARSAEVVIVPSRYLKEVLMRWGVSEEKIRVVYNSFDPVESDVTREETRRILGLSGKVLVSAGRLVPWKGFDALIALMPRLRLRFPDLILVIAGDGPEREKYESRIKNQESRDSIRLTGAIPRGDFLAYLRSADAFVLNTGYEGFSHTILEAMAARVPVVTTAVGGNTELIENGKSGFLVEYNNCQELSAAIERVLTLSSEEHAALIDQALQVARQFTRERMIRETKTILDRF